MFPIQRMRRLRCNETVRGMLQETRLTPWDFIYPLFVVPGKGVKNEVASLPGVYQLSVDMLEEECNDISNLQIPAVLLFGLPEEKDAEGICSLNPNGPVQNAIRFIKKKVPKVLVIADVCLCEYTTHGHCGLLTDNGEVDNDATLTVLAKQAVSYAQAGADWVAPSDMMDGRVAAIRQALDKESFENVAILSYAAKFASSFYGPFRDAADCAPKFGNRKTYQMNPGNGREAIREVKLDVLEGADGIIVKPGMPYMDILWQVKEKFGMPTVSYQVSGEYAMIKAAGRNGWINESEVMMESLLSLKRGGADAIITYFAKDAAKILLDEYKR